MPPSAEPDTPEVAQARRVDRLARLAWALRHNDPKRALARAEQACALAEAHAYERGLAEGLLARAFAHFALAAHDKAQHDAEAAQALFERLGQVRGLHKALNLRGMICGDQSRFAEALELFLALHNRCREHADAPGEADALNNAALVCTYLGDYPNALEMYLRALQLAEALGDTDGVAARLENIGLAHLEMERFEEARRSFGRALETRGNRFDPYRASTLINLGRVYEGLGDFERALSYSRASLELAARQGDPVGTGYAYDNIGSVYLKLGETARARESLERALALKTQDRDLHGEAQTRLLLGALYRGQGELGSARATFEAARAGAAAVGGRAELFRAHLGLAEVYEAQGEYREALEHYKAFVRTKDEVFSAVSDHKLQSLRVFHEVADKEREKEIVRLRNVELVRANDELRRVQEALEQQAREDPLTGLYNRRYLEPQLRDAFASARRNNTPLAVALCDVDDFKRINDTFSHGVGDRVLVAVAGLFRVGVRASDVVARYGGEEFALLLPDLTPGEAAALCERLRAAVEAYPWSELCGGLRVTVSIGLAADVTVADHEKLVARADARLYEAKRAGKNRVL